jgi:hypothetical protein
MNSTANEIFIADLLRLRAIVAFLGEKKQFGWWDSSLLDPIGQKVMLTIFPRSASISALNASAEAARKVHDERIGRGRVYHLFRLPPITEQNLHTFGMESAPRELRDGLNTETALAALGSFCESESQRGQGPMKIGTAEDLKTNECLTKIATAYFSAFSHNVETFPYFTGVNEE